MKAISFECEIITPMFMAGADGKTPELRPPSIKGMMRFWWRAMNGHLPLDELWKKEGELFGASDEKIGRSKFALKIICSSNLKIDSYKPVTTNKPVTTKTFKAQAFVPERQFALLLTANSSFKEYETICNVLKVSLLLGGLGKRSRRGFGSVRIVTINDSGLEFICDSLNAVAHNGFEVDGNKIKRSASVQSNSEYPYIKEIKIGDGCKDYEKLLKIIGESSHKNDCKYTGFALGQDRLASPIYVSVIKDGNNYKPIITRLNPAFKHQPKNYEPDNSDAFIFDILAG